MEGQKLRICTLNVRGLNEKKKRISVIEWFKNERIDILCLQETFCTDKSKALFDNDWKDVSEHIYHSLSDSAHSRGVCIIFDKKLTLDDVKIKQSEDGRRILINAKVNRNYLSIVNVYAPNNVMERIAFFKRTNTWVKQNIQNPNNLILCGDLNSVLEPKDRTTGKVENCAVHFRNMIKSHKLEDTYRKLNPNKDGFTWINPANPSQKSRLDYVLTSGFLMQYVKQIDVCYAPTPDHLPLILDISITINKRGRGYWKLNTSILNEELYKQQVGEIISETKEEYENMIGKREIWDLCKVRIKEYSIKYCICKSKDKKDEINHLTKHLNEIDHEIDQNLGNMDYLKKERDEIKRHLDDLYYDKAKGHQIRSRAKWIEQGEKNTSYFASLETKRQTFNTIMKLQTQNGDKISDDKGILDETVNFYRKLYTSTNPDENKVNDYIQNTNFSKKLNVEDKEICEGLVSKNECENALKHMKKNKSPGIDGLPVEFYQTFWDLIGDLLVDTYNEAYEKEQLALTQRTSILSLIFKKGDRLFLKNYRPISLATTDYKILAFAMAFRLQKVLNNIIGTTQAAYIKKRFIGCNIRLIEDILDYSDKLNEQSSLIFLDFQKAFDSVEWTFLFKTLEAFGFGPSFIKWIKTMYNNSLFKTKNNGWLSESVSIKRGIRQGCPVSALLFIMVVEVLSLRIKQDLTINGLKIDDKIILMLLFADDCILLLNDHKSIQNAIFTIQKFSEVTGLKLNIEKSEAMSIQNGHEPEITYGLKWVTNTRCLGLYVGHNKKINYEKNWREKIEAIEKIIQSWKHRHLTLMGKILLVKMLLLPKVIFAATNTSTPDNVIQDINKLLYRFIWNGPDKIKRNIITSTNEQGGLGMIDVESFFTGIKSSWISRYIVSKNQPWCLLMAKYMDMYGKDLLINMTFDKPYMFPNLSKIPLFYREVILSFNKCKSIKRPTNNEEVLESIIWGNKHFTIKEKNQGRKEVTLWFPSWVNVGIVKVKDIMVIDGNINEQYIFEKLETKRNFLTEMYKLKLALKDFKGLMKTNIPIQNAFQLLKDPILKTGNQDIALNDKKARFYYREIMKKNVIAINFKYWDRFDSLPQNSVIIKNKVLEIKENKLAEFNYKFLYGIVACGKWISKWDKDISDKCRFCQNPETQEHIIYECPLAHTTWTKISTILSTRLSLKDIVFGIEGQKAINNLISQVSYSIHKYWIRIQNTKDQPMGKNLTRMVSHDLHFKHYILDVLKEREISALYQRVSEAMK